LSNRFIKWVYSLSDSKALLGKCRRRTKLNISAILLENAVTYHHVIYHLPPFEYRIAYFSTGTLKNVLFSDCAQPSVQFITRAFCAKHVVYPHPLHAVNFLQFSDEKTV